MKKVVVSLMSLMLACLCIDLQACDNDFSKGSGDSNSFYAEIFGGANFLQTEKRGGIKSYYRTDYLTSGSLGYRWCYGLRLEAEYAYRRNTLHKEHFFGRSFGVHGHFQSSSYMANVLWDLPLSKLGCGFWKIKPFIGGGIGYDYQQIRTRIFGLNFRENKKHFAWQVITGVGYPIFCHTDLSLEYKYHKGGFKHIHNHSVGLGLTYKFGSL